MKKRADKLSSVVFCVLIALIVLLAISNYLTSGLYARYLSFGESSDDARVAKWEINFKDEDGNVLDSSMPSVYLDNGTKGEWGIDIVNSSEVTAKLTSESSVNLRLYSPNFDIHHDHNTWNFLEDGEGNHIDNPINFKVCLYNCNLVTLKNYLVDGVFTANGDGVYEQVILDTTLDLHFEMKIEDGLFYYETNVTVGELAEHFNISPNDDAGCLRVIWEVEDTLGAVVTDDNYESYHLVNIDDYDSSLYNGVVDKSTINGETSLISILDGSSEINTILENNSFVIDDKTYVIAYKNHDYFDYFIYTSSIGGEVMITTVEDEEVVMKKASKLSSDEETELLARTISNPYTMDSVELYVEKLEYTVFSEFINVKSQHDVLTGYVSLGLECRLSLNLKVEQVD